MLVLFTFFHVYYRDYVDNAIFNYFFFQVYCRIRPLDNPNDDACLKATSTNTCVLTQTEVCIVIQQSYDTIYLIYRNHCICRVMVRMLVLNVVNRGFERRFSQIKDYMW